MSSIDVTTDPAMRYLLRIGDTCLVHAQRLAEWCGHAPVLEEDIALANMALDVLGQARAVLSHAATLEGVGHDEDQLAFLRRERDYLNVTMVELPRGDFAFTTLRNLLVSCWLEPLWGRLQASGDAQVAAIAAKAVKEARYHRRHAADWLARLGDGTEESAARVRVALDALWPYTRELFDDDAVDEQAAHTALGPRWSELKAPWLDTVGAAFAAAGLAVPAEPRFTSDGKRGRHSEHMGHLLSELQYLQRAYPGGAW